MRLGRLEMWQEGMESELHVRFRADQKNEGMDGCIQQDEEES